MGLGDAYGLSPCPTKSLATVWVGHYPPDDEEEQIEEAVAEAPASVPDRLQQRARMVTERFVSLGTPRSINRALSVLDTLLTLPCFSPALAASDVSTILQMARQTVLTAEGVRVEFQQLPAVAPSSDASPSLRVIVDASSVRSDAEYTLATLTVAGGEDSPLLFSVPLNGHGRGLLDVQTLSPAMSARRLIAIHLSTG